MAVKRVEREGPSKGEMMMVMSRGIKVINEGRSLDRIAPPTQRHGNSAPDSGVSVAIDIPNA